MYTYTHSRKWRYIKPARCCSVFFQIKFTKIVPLLLRKWAASRFNRISHTNQKMLRTPDYLHIQKRKVHDLEILPTQNKQVSCHCQIQLKSNFIVYISVRTFNRRIFILSSRPYLRITHRLQKEEKTWDAVIYMLLWWVVGVSDWGMSGGYSKWDTLQFKLSLSSRDTHPFLSTHRLPTASHTYTLPSLHKEWKSVPQLLATVE